MLVASYKAFIPPIFDPEGGAENAEIAFRKYGQVTNDKLLLVEYFNATSLPPLKKDPKLFDELIEKILTTDPSVLKNGALMNSIAQEKAKKLKTERDYLFP